ncbi:unnamed protein product [Alopecurus aequalis]
MAAAKFFNISPYSFHPPDRDATTRSPDWVLLDTKAYISDRRNGTTATAQASNGAPVEVTFWVAEPPVFSHFSVHCKDVSGFAEEPRIICSDKDVAVLCIYWASTRSVGPRELPDYFVYTASSRSSKDAAPSLIRLPNPFPLVINPREMGLLPTVDGEGFVIAVLRRQDILPGLYHLHVFLSKNWRWITISLLLEPQSAVGGRENSINKHITDKQRARPQPRAAFHPLPKPMARNMDIKNCAWLYRDVAFINGLIKFVELETWENTVQNTVPKNESMYECDEHIADIQFDSDLEDDDSMCADLQENSTESTLGWRAVAWVRETSRKAWIKDYEAKIDDINIDGGTRRAHSLPPLESLMTAAPTLSTYGHGDDVVVYLMSKLKINDDNAWLVAINMTSKTLEDLAVFSAKRIFKFNTTYRPSSFSRHLDMTSTTDSHEAGSRIKEEEDDSEDTTAR